MSKQNYGCSTKAKTSLSQVLLFVAILQLLTTLANAQTPTIPAPTTPSLCTYAYQPVSSQTLLKKAEAGDVNAQCILGFAYYLGSFVQKDQAQSLRWTTAAAGQGSALAQALLGFFYDLGIGVERNDVTAVKWYQLSAAQGNAVGQNNLGLMYLEGRGGLPQSSAEALDLFQKAAAQNSLRASTNLATMYLDGKGVPKDYSKAIALVQPAANRGEPSAESILGYVFWKGYGVKRDQAEAMRLTRSAAEKGFPEAQYNLAQMYYFEKNGIDSGETIKWFCLAAQHGFVPAQTAIGDILSGSSRRDYVQAAKWYRKAADAGNPEAQMNLGILYANGQGVPLDYVRGFAWLSRAKAAGLKRATQALHSLRDIMTPKQLMAAEFTSHNLARETSSDDESLSSVNFQGDACSLESGPVPAPSEMR